WLDEALRVKRLFRQDCEATIVAQFGGAAGTLASLGADGLDIRREFAVELGLPEPTATWHTSRDRLLRYGTSALTMAILAQKIGREIVDLQRTEILELEEPHHHGKVGSSTMPHKRNPALAETVVTLGMLAQ